MNAREAARAVQAIHAELAARRVSRGAPQQKPGGAHTGMPLEGGICLADAGNKRALR